MQQVQVLFSQLLQLVKSLSDAVADLTVHVQLLLAVRQDSTSSLPSPSINGIQREKLLVELREFDESNMRTFSLSWDIG